ncbi:MAG: hypothetical protein OEZ52_10530, partial [Candidatus Aminicenantes bacterium]|nr:hypothetical protein [Candidatus Aminicenantes bacterium]
INATQDAVCVVATERGKHSIRLPKVMIPMDGGLASTLHRLDMNFGDVQIFVRPVEEKDENGQRSS